MEPVSNWSLRDADQIVRYEHEDDACAKRVFVVGGDFKLDIDPSQITNAVKEGLKTIEIKSSPMEAQKEIQIQTIEVPVPIIQKEVQIERIEISVPVIQQELKIVEIEKPIIQEKVVTVDKPIFIQGETQVVQIAVPHIVEKIVEKIPAFVYAIITLEAAIIAFLVLK
jgi:hypothetical protein